MYARIALLAAGLCCIASAAFAEPAVSPDTLAQAKAVYAQVATGKLDRSSLTPALRADLGEGSEAVLAQHAAALGTPDRFTPIGQTDVDGVTTTIFRLHFATGVLDFNFGVDDATKKIAKLYFVPGPSNDPTL